MDTPKILYQFPDLAGKSFCPSNGTEGMIFTHHFCDRCIHEKWNHTQNHDDKKCDILSRSMVYDQQEEGYPREWRFNSEGWPTCANWQYWDWGNDGDPDDEDNPNAPPKPPPPNQLNLFPLFPNETYYEEKILNETRPGN